MKLSRRRILQGLGVGAAAAAAGLGVRRIAHAEDGLPRFLVILGCFGGASALDCILPVDVADAASLPGRGRVIAYPTANVGPFRVVDRPRPVEFFSRFGADALVLGTQSSSVNHFVAQARWCSGRDMLHGQTMAEAVAAAHGRDMPLPNVNMGRGGYAASGADPGLDPRFRAEVVTNPITFPLSTHASAGALPLGETAAQDPAFRERLLGRARAYRDGTLETESAFARTFAASRRRRELLVARRGSDRALEAEDLISRLFFVPDLGDLLPLSEWGLRSSDETDRVLDLLDDAFPANTQGTPQDRLHAQAALAYLLLRTGTSCAVTLTEPGTDGFLAFDQSHTDHRSAQATHWDRVLDVAGRLITLLQGAELEGPDGPTGQSLWSRTMLVFATEFGRDKWDDGSRFGTGHHLNNGMLVLSPLLRGGQSLGRPDPQNGFICGFDPVTGAPTPFTDIPLGTDPLFSDPRLPPGEEAVWGTLLAGLGVRFDGQQTLPVLLRS
jgi:hypothetical protein